MSIPLAESSRMQTFYIKNRRVFVSKAINMKQLEVKHSGKAIVPFLVQRSTQRTDAPKLPGQYCQKARVWMIDGPSGRIPLVCSAEGLPEMATKTLTSRESDDQYPSLLLAAMTKTSAQLERDDTGSFSNCATLLLELATKTEANRERDD